MKHTVEEFYFNLQQYAALCQLDCKEFFKICGAMCVPGVTTDEQKAALIERLKKHATEIVECLKSF